MMPDTTPGTIPLSVLDLALVAAGTTSSAAVHDATTVAVAADALGFRRFWVTEFHDSPITANASPPVLLAHVAAATRRIRVGSGAMLLPYHRPLMLAEQFGTLAALHPGRVDVGLGRGSGTGRETARLLAVEGTDPTPHGERVQQVVDHLAGAPGPHGRPVRIPRDPCGEPVPVFVLGSHVESAELAGALGLPYVFGHHLTPAAGDAAVAAYRAAFHPTAALDRPYVVVCVQTICGETDGHARTLLRPIVVAGAQKGRGDPVVLPPVAEVAGLPWTPDEEAAVEGLLAAQAVGGPTTVADRLADIAARLCANEIIVTASVPDAAERVRSLERLHSAWCDRVTDTPRGVRHPRHDEPVGSRTGPGAEITDQGEPDVHASA